MATGSVGFQAGISVSEGVTMVMTDKGFNSLLATSFKMGGDASVAAGPVGAGAKSDIVADLITFNRAKGVYGGLNFDGTVVTAADDWNQAYYGKKVLPPDILVRMTVSNKAADKLLAQVTVGHCQEVVPVVLAGALAHCGVCCGRHGRVRHRRRARPCPRPEAAPAATPPTGAHSQARPLWPTLRPW